MDASSQNGILVVDKPCGPTSHDIVASLRRALGVRPVGHAGTLDPMATGVLVVAVGEATKLVPWLTAHDKTYEATIALGVETDTLDACGREVGRAAVGEDLLSALERTRGSATAPLLRDALELERARTSQMPPIFSAIRTRGERSFARARRGESPQLAPREVCVKRLDLVASSADPPWLAVAVVASKGYYVRALARDLAHAFGTVGHLTRLRRTRSGCFDEMEAVSPESSPEELRRRIHRIEDAAARALPLARLTARGVREARHGRRVPTVDIDSTASGACAWLGPCGELVAIGHIDQDGWGAVVRGFATPT